MFNITHKEKKGKGKRGTFVIDKVEKKKASSDGKNFRRKFKKKRGSQVSQEVWSEEREV